MPTIEFKTSHHNFYCTKNYLHGLPRPNSNIIMGDLIQITTWPKHQNLFYLVTGSGLAFDVKAIGNAAVGLSRKPTATVDYWIGIGDNNQCWIKKDDAHCKSSLFPNIISSLHYTRFWLQWNGGVIRLGKHGEPKPIVVYRNQTPDLKYITFSSLRETNSVHWRFELAPMRPKPYFKSISDGKLTWVEAENQLPDGALIGGYQDEIIYIVRAQHRMSLTPGKFIPSEGLGYISWGGDAHEKSEFEVLCGFDCTWVNTSEDKIPVGAVIGGYSEDRQERLYVGRAAHNGHIIPGKVQPSHKVCYIPFKGREIAKKKYQILVEPSSNRRCVNSTYILNVNIDSASESDQDDAMRYHSDEDPDDDSASEERFDSFGSDLHDLMVL